MHNGNQGLNQFSACETIETGQAGQELNTKSTKLTNREKPELIDLSKIFLVSFVILSEAGV
ncbi:hypothetical protein BVY04_02820 [bacterium M21]|nr:hypothetical protein BVY04_02820 [bacterium M21]